VKRSIPILAVVLFTLTAPLFALDDPDRPDRANRGHRTIVVVDDVIRMSQAGVSDDAIISYVRNTRDPFDVNADDIIAMTDAHVSKEVVKAVVDEASVSKDRTRERGRERAYVAPSYYYDPFYYPGYYYDPFWYRSSVYLGFTFGPRFIGRGHIGRGFRHR
jgi:hypothetical protein